MVTSQNKIVNAMSDHDMITWNLNLKKQTKSNIMKGLRNYNKIKRTNFASQPWEKLAEGTTEEMAIQFNDFLM
jgi:hypothetical protein